MDCDLSKYEVVVAPMLYMIREGVGEIIEEFVNDGGTFITTYWSGIVDEPGCKGVPDLVVEIISPSSGKRDRKTKRDLYERHGVKEYWLVDYPAVILDKNTLEIFIYILYFTMI